MSRSNASVEKALVMRRELPITKHRRALEFMPAFWRLGMVLVFVPLFALGLYSQAFYGSLVGTITDPSGAVVPGAAVTLTNTETGVQQQVKSGPAGIYQFFNLIPGSYRVDVEASGFKKATHQNVQVTVSGTARTERAATALR